LAQSVGGGGGIGGSNTSNSSYVSGSAQATLTGGVTLGLGINVGGNSGSGGDGGTVTIVNPAGVGGVNISTAGYASVGILAQSIGGGGGIGHDGSVFSASGTVGTGLTTNSSYTTPSVNLGAVTNGSAGVAGSGGTVNIGTSNTSPLQATISTLGDDSTAVFAQSVGGGGGLASVGCSNSGQSNVSYSTYVPSACYQNAKATALWNGQLTPSEFIGGVTGQPFDFSVNDGNSTSESAATGAGAINVYADLVVTTYGDRSMGLVSQSITGGGGFISAPNQIINSVTMPTKPRALNSSPGNQTINLSNSAITTYGDGAWGVFAQMVQGGGGFFGDPSQDLAFNVKYDLNSNAAEDVFAAGSGVQVTQIAQFQQNQIADVHSWNYSSCITGTCTITEITPGLVYMLPYTNGEVSWAQGDYVQISPSLEQSSPYQVTQYAADGSVKTNIGQGSIVFMANGQFFLIGSEDKTGVLYSSPGTVVDYNESIHWNGISAPTYSDVNQFFLGAYGGALGTVSGMSMLVNINDLATSNSNLGWTNNPIAVTLDETAIQTYGANSHGVVLQNLGAVGGAWSSNGAKLQMGVTLTGNNSAGNTPGGQITLDMTASTVVANGPNSRGVIIQSDGAGPGGSGSQGIVTVSLKQSSNITSSWSTALVLLGSSYDSKSPSTITVDATSSISQGNFYETGYSAAVDNTEGSYNYWAVYAPTGYTSLTNNGTITGNILLGIVTRGEFSNKGTWYGSTALIASNSLHNYGRVYPAGDGVIGDLYVYGSLKHYAGGELHVDVQSSENGPSNDMTSVSGLARIEGEIVPEATSLLLGSYEILTAGTLDYSGSVRDSHVFDWVAAVNGNTLTMAPTANFAPSGYSLTGNQASLADYLQRGWETSERSKATLFGYLHEHELGAHTDYQSSLNELMGQTLNAQPVQFQTAFSTYLGDSLSCPTVTQQGLKLNQDDCVWAKITGDITEQSSNNANPGYHSSGGGIRLGAQRSLGHGWSAGFGLGYGLNYLTSTNFSSNGQFFDLSVSASKEIGQWRFGGSLGFAQGWFENNRYRTMVANGAADSMDGLFTSQSRMTMAGFRLRAAYEYTMNVDQYLKPYLDLDLVFSHTPGYSESGSAPLGLSVKGTNRFNVAITPMLEYGLDFITQDSSRVKLFVSAGASFLPNNNVKSQASFQGLSSNLGTFDVLTDGPTVLGRLNLGIQAFSEDNMEVRLQYGLLAGDGYVSQNLSVNATWRF
jgi:hypothetical protein